MGERSGWQRVEHSMLLVGRTGRIGVGCQDLLRGGGLTTGRHGSVSLDVGGGFWIGRAQGQQVAACLSAGLDRKCSAA